MYKWGYKAGGVIKKQRIKIFPGIYLKTLIMPIKKNNG